VKRFSAIQRVKALSWIPAFAGMTLLHRYDVSNESLLLGVNQNNLETLKKKKTAILGENLKY
jgi:hypothetical protein